MAQRLESDLARAITLSSSDPELVDWVVDSIGPVSPAIRDSQSSARAGNNDGRSRTPIVTTYPNGIEKVYWQLGGDTSTSMFENMNTGYVTSGVSNLVEQLNRESQ